MLNLVEKQLLNSPVVFGGNINGTLVKWLKQLQVDDFLHASIAIKSIDPIEIKKSAEHIKTSYGHMKLLFSVGTFAHKTLIAAGLEHGALPPTSTKDKKIIEAALNDCRYYLIRSNYYAAKSSPTISS
jgi:hypothetical protein